MYFKAHLIVLPFNCHNDPIVFFYFMDEERGLEILKSISKFILIEVVETGFESMQSSKSSVSTTQYSTVRV